MNYYKVISLVLLSLLLGVMATLSSADIYRWVDDDGQVHFGDKPGTGQYDVIEQEPDPVKPAEPALESQPEKKQTPVENNSVETDTPVSNGDTEGTTEEEKSEEVDAKETELKEAELKEEKPELTAEEKVEAARQKRISDMEALSEELRISREKRETKREKKKEELRLLREGCVTAMERVSYLQAQLDHYVSLQPRRKIDRAPEDVPLDTKHERIAAELKIRRKYVEESCDNL